MIYKPIYALTNQSQSVKKKHLAILTTEIEDFPKINITTYIPIVKYKHWKANLPKPFKLGFMEKYPEISMNKLTHIQQVTHRIILVAEATGSAAIVDAVGVPRA
jgi:hypothetical protein